MRPVLFTVLGVEVPAYFAMLSIGLVLATWLGSRWIGRLGLDRELIWDLGLAMTIAGVIGSRILHVLADGYFWDYVHLCTDPSRVAWPFSREDCLSRDVGGLWDAAAHVCRPPGRRCFAWAEFWNGGLTFYGGLVGATAYAVYFLRRERFSFLLAADMAGFVIPLGLAWGRMGCFLAGCCFGRVTHGPFGVRFPAFSPATEMHVRLHRLPNLAHASLPVHPTQLYESVGALIIALVAYLIVVPRKKYHGQVFVFFIVAYGILRTAVEALREDDRGGVVGVSTSQWISLILIAVVVPFVRRIGCREAASQAKADA